MEALVFYAQTVKCICYNRLVVNSKNDLLWCVTIYIRRCKRCSNKFLQVYTRIKYLQNNVLHMRYISKID